MNKPTIKFEGGVLKVAGSFGLDTDKDLKESVALTLQLDVNAMEAINEIFKNDPAWLMEVLAGLGIK